MNWNNIRQYPYKPKDGISGRSTQCHTDLVTVMPQGNKYRVQLQNVGGVVVAVVVVFANDDDDVVIAVVVLFVYCLCIVLFVSSLLPLLSHEGIILCHS